MGAAAAARAGPDAAFSAVASWRPERLDALVTHRFPFAQTPEAFAFADREKRTSMKVMINVR